ncbi:MAG: FecR domain-containing protein, partial [Candidatus Firestonebacteria bacterium]|nr:FecR domain-containing protein [Candidatus Firestonebacteria bacterium]
MNWLKGLALGVLCLAPSLVSAEDLGAGRISFIQGQAQIQPAGAKDWQVASVNVPVRAGDRFWTPEEARLELQFQNGTVVRLDTKSTLDVLSLTEDAMQFHLSMGHLLFRTSRKPAKIIQVDLPDSSLVVQDKALFRVDITPDGGEEFGIFQGAMEIATSGSKTRIRTGEMLSLENGSSEVSPLKAADEWEQWNTDRDREQMRAAAASPYLPPELNVYADDLNRNGEWVNVPDYGYCWTPRVGISLGWAPFRFGSWLWMDDDWLWVSSEPWGWAPYHYGRWTYYSNRWCWVPPLRGEIHWGHGYVGWIHTPRYIGWVPLAPGEEFRRGVPFRGQFHNVPHAGASTVVERGGFASGRMVPINPRENIFAAGKHQVGSPDIRPAGNLHVGPAVSANRLPSKAIRSQDIRQIRQQHPQLRVVPPQTHQYRQGYRNSERGQIVRGQPRPAMVQPQPA